MLLPEVFVCVYVCGVGGGAEVWQQLHLAAIVFSLVKDPVASFHPWANDL